MTKILLIEDCDEDAVVVEDTICREISGVALTRIVRSEDALELLKSNSYACILLDLELPGLSGLDFLEQLRESRMVTPPIVVVTGRGDESKAVRAMQLGAKDYVSKTKLSDACLAMVIQNVIGDRELEKSESQQRLDQKMQDFSRSAQDSLLRVGQCLMQIKES